MRGVSIMIEDTLSPNAAKCSVFAAGKNRGIFHGDAALVVVAVERPGLQLAAREFSFVHQQVKGMFMMITFLANGMKARHELGCREKHFRRDRCLHRTNSM